MGFEFSGAELDTLMGGPNPGSPPSPTPSPSSSSPLPPPSPSSSLSSSPLSPTPSPLLSPSTPSPAPHSKSFGGVEAYRQAINPSGAVSRFNEPTLEMRGTPIRDKLGQREGPVSEEMIQRLEQRFEEVKDRLLGAAAAMGRSGEMLIEFDPVVPTFALTLETPRVFKVGPLFLSKLSTEDLIHNALHEGGHGDLTRIGSGFFFKSEILRVLFNVAEDIRIDARVIARAPGRKDSYLKFLRSYFYEEYEKLPKDKIPKLLPHEAFLQGIMSREYGGASPWDQDPIVGKAIEEVWAAIQEIKASRPQVRSPQESVVQEYVAQVEALLKEQVLPTYLRLYEKALKEVEALILQQRGQASSPGPGRGRAPLIDPRDLSEEAKKELEDRARKIADAHAPKGSLGDKQKRAREIFGEESEAPPVPKKASVGGGGLVESLEKRNEAHHRQQAALRGKTYSKLISGLKDLPQKVFTIFDRLLKPNTDFEYEGYHTSGPKPDIERAVKAALGLMASLKVFKRKTEATGRDYRFSLLLDASGSMADGGVRERGGLGLAAMFTDVFERLELPYSLDAFHDDYLPLKGFHEKLKTVEERDRFFNHVLLNHWGNGGTNFRQGIRGALKKIEAARKGDFREEEFLFVLSDGKETHGDGPSIRQLCEAAAKRGVIVVGIGIGEGMEMVREHFPVFITEKNPENLPNLLAEFIKHYVLSKREVF